MLRYIRLVTGDNRKYNPYIIFCTAQGGNPEEYVPHFVRYGVCINGHRFVYGPRSASMTRNGIFSFIDVDIADEVLRRVSLGVRPDKVVLSKLMAYQGLCLSSCHCMDDWRPKVIVVPDYKKVVPKQKVRHLCDREVQIPNEDGEFFTWQQKDIEEEIMDVEINAFDGAGLIHPNLAKEITERIDPGSERITSFIFRGPYIKGMLHAVDYGQYLSDHGVDFVRDLWGHWHSVHDEMIILTKSQFKAYDYFKKSGTLSDFDDYMEAFNDCDACWGIARCNFSFDEEPRMTQCNYQVMQTLDLTYDKFRGLADYSMDWVSNIVDGDELYMNCYLGLTADKCKPINPYVKSILLNPEMAKEKTVRGSIVQSISKMMDDMKCGRLWQKGSFKFLAPDLIAMLQHIGGMEVTGFLSGNEFFGVDAAGIITGERIVLRNPHITSSENVVMGGVRNDEAERYLSHLANVIVVNINSLIAQRLNGADFDGDIALVVDNQDMIDGVHRDEGIVIDTEDKVAAIEEEDNVENRCALALRTMKSFIGEYSNYASAFWNKCPRTDEQKDKYKSYIDVASIIVGKSIDYAKTGVIYHMPRHISKYGRPLPYFMKYRSQYYSKQKLSRAPSNMNKLCWDIERWERDIRWKRTYKDFDYHIMIDDSIPINPDVYEAIRDIYLRFSKEMAELAKDQASVRQYSDSVVRNAITKYDAEHFTINWGYYYDLYKAECLSVCPDVQELANICVKLCYEDMPNKNVKFMWVVAEEGILKNIKPVDVIRLPKMDECGDREYLGRRYSMVDVKREELSS